MFRRQTISLAKHFATATTVNPKQSININSTEKISKLPNGLTVASVDTGGVISQLIMGYRAGSRYEQYDEAGLTHHLRNAVGTDSANYESSLMLWHCGSAGARLISSLTRDLFMVQMSIVRDHASIGLSLLGELSQPALKPWDIEDRNETLFVDLDYLTPLEKLMEKLHYAAYREGPLGNRLFAERDRVGKITFDQLQNYAASRLVSGQTILFGFNIDHNQMLKYASEQLNMNESSGKAGAPSPYYGGEIRYKQDIHDVHVAIAGQGNSLKDSKALAVQAVFSAALGQGPSTKYCCHFGGHGIVAEAVFKASNSYPFGIAAINEVYSDNGLVGIYLTCDGDRAAPLIDAAIKAIKNFSISEAEIRKAKAIATMNVYFRSENSSAVARDRVEQILATGQATTISDFVKLIDSVTSADVNKLAKQVSSKLTLVSYGNVYNVPYLDNL